MNGFSRHLTPQGERLLSLSNVNSRLSYHRQPIPQSLDFPLKNKPVYPGSKPYESLVENYKISEHEL